MRRPPLLLSFGYFPDFRVLLLVLLAFVGAGGGAGAQNPDEIKRLAKQLEELKNSRQQSKQTALRGILQEVRTAGQSGPSAVTAYGEAVRSVQMAGRPGAAAEFQEWRKSQGETLNSPDFREAVQLHLRYLALTLDRAASDEPEKFVEPSLQYLDALHQTLTQQESSKEKPPRLVEQVLQESVRDGLFSEYWNLAPFFVGLEKWEWSPGHVEGILDKNIRPYLREAKDPRILETWTWQIKREQARFTTDKNSFAAQRFRDERLPELQMQQATDLQAMGDSMKAVRQGLQILQQHPEHPHFEEWTRKIEGWLTSLSDVGTTHETTAQP